MTSRSTVTGQWTDPVCSTQAICNARSAELRFFNGLPSSSIEPCAVASIPASAASRVDFPAPLGPISPTSSPANTCRDTSLTMLRLARVMVTELACSLGCLGMVFTGLSQVIPATAQDQNQKERCANQRGQHADFQRCRQSTVQGYEAHSNISDQQHHGTAQSCQRK